MTGTSRPTIVSTKLQRIAELARQAPQMVFTTLAHHIDVDFLREAYRRTRKDGAVGVDEVTAAEYAVALDVNRQSLWDRFHKGQYFAPPVRRVHIPKHDGRTRPIGVPTFEDKILQRAVTMVLEAVYEQDFLDCSYGFRPRRSAHAALKSLWDGIMAMEGGWIVEVDIQSFFDTLDHRCLREMLDQRVRDGVLRRAIDKWLKAGVLERGQLVYSESGTPQGGVLSPLLANIYLHEVLDKWFERDVKPRLGGTAFLVRYADDFVIAFHPEKTRLIEFRKPRGGTPPRDERPGTFDLLGFTHGWGLSRRGPWVVTRRTSRTRFTRALRAIAIWCRKERHLPIREQSEMLGRKLRGYFNYYGIRGNSRALARFFHEVQRVWRKWLNRRNGRRDVKWDRFNRIIERYPLPPPRIAHWHT